MNFNLREVYKTYENLKEKHDFKEYEDEEQKTKNNKIIQKFLRPAAGYAIVDIRKGTTAHKVVDLQG